MKQGTIKKRRKAAFYHWAYGGHMTRYKERLLKRWWKQSGRAKLLMQHTFGVES